MTSGVSLDVANAVYVKRLLIFDPYVRIELSSVSEEYVLLNIMFTFELVMQLTKRRFASSFGTYMTLSSVIGTLGSPNDGSEMMVTLTVPH